MFIIELLDLLKQEQNKNYLVVSKNTQLLDDVRSAIQENIKPEELTSRVSLVHPIGIHLVTAPLDRVFVEQGCSSEEHIRKHLTLQPHASVEWF